VFTARYELNIYVTCRLIAITAEAWIRSWTTACDFYGGQSCTQTYFPLSTSVFSCHFSSTNASNSSLSTSYSYEEKKMGEMWGPSEKLCPLGNRVALGSEVLSLRLQNVNRHS
jgi:hypothetical protein